MDRITPTQRPRDRVVMYQKWRHLLFLHWAVPPAILRPLVPPELELDLFEGRAFVGLIPFTMKGVRPAGLPAVPALSNFHETNVRTYVHFQGRDPGVWFFSLDAANVIAVRLARRFYHLPYHHARMFLECEHPTRPADSRSILYAGARRWPERPTASYLIRGAASGPVQPARAGTLEHFLVERYLKPVGVIEAGVFYKYLTDPIFPVGFPVSSGTFAGFNESQSINGPSAHITGLEMAWQQRLSFLPGLLNGMGVRANYSYTNSQASFPVDFGRTDHAALARQAPNNWNFDATYDKKGLSARMGLTHNDANIFQYNFQDGADGGIKGPNGDIYLYPHTQVDAQVSYWIPRGRGLQAIVSLLNLNNEVFGFYNGSPQYVVQREYYHPTYAGGLRWTLGREH